MNLTNQKILIIGLGRSGAAAARFLIQHGARVTVSDRCNQPMPAKQLDALAQLGVRLELGGHCDHSVDQADAVVLSPGVPSNLPMLDRARNLGTPIYGEIELAWRFLTTPMIAITGTNGKTTTTTMIGQMLEASGKTVFVGGNIGNPLINYVAGNQQADIAVVEISSFQIDSATSLRPHIAVLLNISDDHLDRYRSLPAYARAKARLFIHQQPVDIAILNADDSWVERVARNIAAQKVYFNAEDGLPKQHAQLDALQSIDFSRSRLPGAHNRANLAAAALASAHAGATSAGIQQVIDTFSGLAHRMAWVAQIERVNYYNDSKATNVDAVAVALAALAPTIILIMGGRDKGGRFSRLAPLIQSRVGQLILIGEAADVIAAALASSAPILHARDMAHAVQIARQHARPGDSVLLSPGCASFDAYQNYQQRGDDFCQNIQQII
jgi:UDP-N-acetylmuramoylalanine--D-glutamate ligase